MLNLTLTISGSTSLITLNIQPSPAVASQSAVVTCNVTNSEDAEYGLYIQPPHSADECTIDCNGPRNPACGYTQKDCTCKEGPPDTDGYCPVGNTEVCYTVSEVTAGMSGVWFCHPYGRSVEGNFTLTVTSKL